MLNVRPIMLTHTNGDIDFGCQISVADRASIVIVGGSIAVEVYGLKVLCHVTDEEIVRCAQAIAGAAQSRDTQ